MENLDNTVTSVYTLLINVGALLFILVDKLTNKQIYMKLFKIASGFAIVRRKYKKMTDEDVNLGSMLCSQDFIIRFYNGIDKFDDKSISSFSKNVIKIARHDWVSSVVLDFTQADMPNDFLKISYLVKLIANGTGTKQVAIYIPVTWSVRLAPYPHIKTIVIDTSLEELNKTRLRVGSRKISNLDRKDK